LAWTSLTDTHAQAAIPAVPADPTQAIPAQPAEPPLTGATATPAPSNATTSPDTTADGATSPAVAVTVLADSSLRDVLQDLAQTWADSQTTNPQMPLTLTNAGTILTQAESNPAWDVVISADLNDVKAMTEKGLLVADGQHSLARNTVVIYGRKALVRNDAPDWFDLIGSEWKKVAMGNTEQVMSGRVAKRALQKHDLFDEDDQKMYVYGKTEALALQVVERDQADAVFVYRTDLLSIQLPGFEVFPLSSEDAPPVFYTAAVGRLAKNPDGARAFINYCGSEAAREIWARHGFETN
jgi:molybdate transport system substrate-binding protein